MAGGSTHRVPSSFTGTHSNLLQFFHTSHYQALRFFIDCKPPLRIRSSSAISRLILPAIRVGGPGTSSHATHPGSV
jgi:hypothetical protein